MDVRLARLLRDSLRLAERLVVQTAQRKDELDHALRRERIARYQATVKADSLAAIARGSVTTIQADSIRLTRRASFLIRQVPYTVSAEVALPQAPDTGVMSVQIMLDTLRLETRVFCGAPDANGIRDATVTAIGPKWVSVRFDRLEQSPGVCTLPAMARERRKSPWLAIALGTGVILDPRGRVGWGVLVGVGYMVKR